MGEVAKRAPFPGVPFSPVRTSVSDFRYRRKVQLSNAIDIKWMKVANELAANIPQRPWPNPPVGAVVVRDGEVVGSGAHFGAGTAHAERKALDQAGELAKGATLYCTLEPCNHHGRTPPCSARVIESGVDRVVIAMLDPNSGVSGGGISAIREAGIEVEVGVNSACALNQVWPFVATDSFRKPYVLLKTAESSDGFLAPGLEQRDKAYFLTGPETKQQVHKLRRWCDAVIVGKTTVEVDAPRLDGRYADDNCPSIDPVPAYVDTNLTLNRHWRDDSRIVFCSNADSEVPAGAKPIYCESKDGQIDPTSLLVQAAENNFNVLMIEGGPHLAESFLKAGLVDRWIRITAPVELGDGIGWPTKNMDSVLQLTTQFPVGEDTWEVFDKLSFNSVLEEVTRGALCSQD